MKTLIINALYRFGAWLNERAHNHHVELAWVRYTYMCPFDNEPVDDIEQTYGYDWLGERMTDLRQWCDERLWDLGEPPF